METISQEIFRQFVLALLLAIPAWRICSRAGLPSAAGLLVFVPYGGYLALSLLLAFRKWPVTAASKDK